MGHNVFVSYKYHDSDVAYLNGYSEYLPKAKDYARWIEYNLNNNSDNNYMGERDGEDLSNKSEDYIWEHLKNRIYISTVTIVLISPNMKEPMKWEKSQWIPWEISYSLRETTRSDRTSRSNAILAVVLPDKYHSYDYYRYLQLFDILKKNMKNGYIKVISWDQFIYNYDFYIKEAQKLKNSIRREQLSIAL